MATKLKKVKLTSVDLVRRGANQKADFRLMKSLEPPVEDLPIDDKTFLLYSSALAKSIQSIQEDAGLNEAEQAEMVQKSFEQFNAAVEMFKSGDTEEPDDDDSDDDMEEPEDDPDDFDEIEEIESKKDDAPLAKSYDVIVEIEKFNPYHGKDGRFASADGAPAIFSGSGCSKPDKAAHEKLVQAEIESFGHSDAKTFADALAKARESCPEKDRWRVTAHTQEELEQEYPGVKMHVTKGGSTVAVTADGDIISVCHAEGDPLRGKDLMRIATENGGKKLDSFSGNHGFYDKTGLEAVSWTSFNEEYAPEGWRKGIDTPEEVIAYRYTGKSTGMDKASALEHAKRFEGETGYDDMIAYRDKMMEE